MSLHTTLIKPIRQCAAVAATAWMLLAGTAQAAGFQKVSTPASAKQQAIEITLWTPCAQAVQSPLRVGPFSLQVRPGCPLPGTGKLPLIVMSHGRGGTALGHHDTAEALADAGFIVASFNHPGDNAFDMSQSDEMAVFYQRPAQVKQIIDFMLDKRSPVAQRIDAQRIGFWGFSRGGYTGLVLAHATPDFAQTQLPCPDAKIKSSTVQTVTITDQLGPGQVCLSDAQRNSASLSRSASATDPTAANKLLLDRGANGATTTEAGSFELKITCGETTPEGTPITIEVSGPLAAQTNYILSYTVSVDSDNGLATLGFVYTAVCKTSGRSTYIHTVKTLKLYGKLRYSLFKLKPSSAHISQGAASYLYNTFFLEHSPRLVLFLPVYIYYAGHYN